MSKLRINHTFIFALISAFLVMQWSGTHIHLSENHDHDGNQYQHGIDKHAHQSVIQHVDVNDLDENDSALSVVDVDNECNSSIAKKNVQKIAFHTPQFQPLLQIKIVRLGHSSVYYSKRGLLDRTSVNPRAPPYLS
jgi:hypothetical protein